MTQELVTNWSLARDMRAFSDNGHLILVIGSARELAGVPRSDLLSGDMVRLYLGAMVDTAIERQALADLHSRLADWTFWPDDRRRVADLADLVDRGRARAVMIGRSSLSDSARAELLRGEEGYLARMQAILALLPAKIGPAAWDELMKVFTPLSLAITLCAIALAISSGVGALVVLGAGIVMVGWSVFDAIGKIVEFCRLFMVADTAAEQDRCAELLAQAIAAIGVGAMIALLTRGGARAVQLRQTRIVPSRAAPPPPSRPPREPPPPPRPSQTPPRTLTPGERLAARRAHHNRMVDDVREELENRGHTMLDRSGRLTVPPGGDGNRAVPDLIGQRPDGRWEFYEIKTGNASLSPGQTAVYGRIGDAIPSDALAQRMGIDAGKPLREALGYVPQVITRSFPGAGT